MSRKTLTEEQKRPFDGKFCCVLYTCDPEELPQMWTDDNPKKDEKSFKVPWTFHVHDVIDFVYREILKKNMNTGEGNGTDYIELLLKTTVVAPETDKPEFILLDNALSM